MDTNYSLLNLISNFEDLKILVNDHQPKIVSLQESLCNGFNLAGYKPLHKKIHPSDRGVSLMVDNSIVSSPVVLQTDLEALATRVTVGKKT